MSRPLPRFTNTTIQDQQKIIEITGGTNNTPPITTTPHSWQQPNPADLRGIPCLARGVGGTIQGTNPIAETIRRDQQRV